MVPVRATVSWWSRMAMVRVEGCALLTTLEDERFEFFEVMDSSMERTAV